MKKPPVKNLMWAAKRIDHLEAAIGKIKKVLVAVYNKETSDDVAIDDITNIINKIKKD